MLHLFWRDTVFSWYWQIKGSRKIGLMIDQLNFYFSYVYFFNLVGRGTKSTSSVGLSFCGIPSLEFVSSDTQLIIQKIIKIIIHPLLIFLITHSLQIYLVL